MSIRKTSGWVGIVLSVVVTVVFGGGSCDGGKTGGGGKSALVGRWDLAKGPTSGNPEAIELLSDGTGIVDERGVTYNIESGRFYITATAGFFGRAASYDYKVSGPRLTLTNDDGEVLKYLKKGHTLSESDVDLFLYGKNPVSKWTKQNLNIETPDSWCYDNKPANCAKYGRLYTWEAANKACQSMGSKWRLPTHGDWNDLVDYMDKGGGGAGKKLKARSGWYQNGNGTDDYGFSAMPGGDRFGGGNNFNNFNAGNFRFDETDGYWWSATESGRSGEAFIRYMRFNYDGVYLSTMFKSSGLSVRCIEN